MKKTNLIVLLFCCFLSISSCSQTLNEEDLKSRNNADNLIEKLLDEEVKGRNYVLLCIEGQNCIVIVENKDSYNEYYIKNSKEVISGNTYNKSNKLLNKMFNKEIYQKGFITFNSDFFKPDGYEVSSGNITYFVFKDKSRNRYGEARLSVLIKPNPIDSEVYTYLIEKLINQ